MCGTHCDEHGIFRRLNIAVEALYNQLLSGAGPMVLSAVPELTGNTQMRYL
jgi:hypothetical protein